MGLVLRVSARVCGFEVFAQVDEKDVGKVITRSGRGLGWLHDGGSWCTVVTTVNHYIRILPHHTNLGMEGFY